MGLDTNPNPYESPRSSLKVNTSGRKLPPQARLAAIISLLCLYLPLVWNPFCDRAVFEMSGNNWPAFVLTLPGEWYAQRCGARMYDYFLFAGLATVCLFALGVYCGKRSWFALVVVNLTLGLSSTLTAYWLWEDLAL
jgi:hypothetical protein